MFMQKARTFNGDGSLVNTKSNSAKNHPLSVLQRPTQAFIMEMITLSVIIPIN